MLRLCLLLCGFVFVIVGWWGVFVIVWVGLLFVVGGCVCYCVGWFVIVGEVVFVIVWGLCLLL